jgi:competence protein ComEA
MDSFRRRWMLGTACLVVLMLATAGSAHASTEATETTAKGESPPVDINTAGEEELTSIPGIGKTMAQRILEWRQQHGPFRRVEDLMKVKGIGEKSLERIRPHVTISGTKS